MCMHSTNKYYSFYGKQIFIEIGFSCICILLYSFFLSLMVFDTCNKFTNIVAVPLVIWIINFIAEVAFFAFTCSELAINSKHVISVLTHKIPLHRLSEECQIQIRFQKDLNLSSIDPMFIYCLINYEHIHEFQNKYKYFTHF